jgi:hypothetical protein
MPSLPLFKPVVYDADAVTYFNKVGTPLSELGKAQVNALILNMKELGIWSTCAHGWLYLPEHSGVPVGATTGVFYDLKGVSNLTMTGFAAAGQTQTVNGPHIWQNGLQTLRSELLGTVPVAGQFGNTNYTNGEDPGFVWGGLWDEPIDFSTGTSSGSGPSTGSVPFTFSHGSGSYSTMIFESSTAGSGSLHSPTNQYYTQRFRFNAPTTRGMRLGIISNGPMYFDYPLFVVFDPTSSYTYSILDANNLSNNAVTGNTVNCYNYNSHYRLGQQGTATVPSVRQFDGQLQPLTNESGTAGYSRNPYAPTQSPSSGFLIDASLGIPATTQVRCHALKANSINPNEGAGSTPFFFFVFQKNTNFGFRRAEKLISFHQTLDKQIAGPQRVLNKFAPFPDRCRLRTAKNRTSTETLPPKVYFGVNGSLSTHCNDPANAYGSFTLDMWCEDEEYSLFPSSITSSLTSAEFQSFLLSLRYRIHDGFSKNNITFPTSPNSFTLGGGTITRNIGLGYKTYRKLCSATYPTTGLHFTPIQNVTSQATTNVATTVTLNITSTPSPLYTVGSIIRIDNEQMLVTAVNSTVLTVTRGYAGTTAAEHNASSIVFIFDPRIRMYISYPSFINNFEVMATDFNLNYIPSYDADALTYFTNTGITDLTARRQINDFVVGVKALGAWSTMVCWPMRSSQNAGTGSTVYSLGGGGTFNGTMAAGATWGSEGIIFNGSTGRVSTALTSITSDHTSMSIFKQASITGNQVTLAKDDQGSNRQFNHVSDGSSYLGQVFNTTARSIFVGTPVAGAFRSIVLRNSASLTNAQPGQWYSNPTQTTATSGTMSAGTSGVSIGSASNSNFFFNGVIPFAAVWTSYLSDTNRATVYRIYRDTLGEGITLPN